MTSIVFEIWLKYTAEYTDMHYGKQKYTLMTFLL